jgi:uncharacterized membrane protein
MAFTATDLGWYICVVVEIYAVMAQIVGVMWIVDVKEMGIMKVARMIVVTRVITKCFIKGNEIRERKGKERELSHS